MKLSILVTLMILITGCGKNKSSTAARTDNLSSNLDTIQTLNGLGKLGLTFEEIGHRTSENQFAILCSDNDKTTNQDRLSNLSLFLQNLANVNNEDTNFKFRVVCNKGLSICYLSKFQVETLTKEAIQTMKYYEILLPSKYCPNSNLTRRGIVVERTNEDLK